MVIETAPHIVGEFGANGIIKNRSTLLDIREIGYTEDGVRIVEDVYAKDVPQRNNKETVDNIILDLMSLPENERNEYWRRLSPVLATFSDNVTNWRALLTIYTRDQYRPDAAIGIDDEGMAQSFYEHSLNALAVRERLTVTRDLLGNGIDRAVRNNAYDPMKPAISLASVACGSAYGFLQSIASSTEQYPQAQIQATMVDIDKPALAFSRQYADNLNIGNHVTVKRGNIFDIKKPLGESSYDVIEAVGIMDYLNDERLTAFNRDAADLLNAGGVVIGANIMENPERDFIETVVGWPKMKYRNTSQFARSFIEAGFKPENCTVHVIPSQVYAIVEARK